MTADDLMLVAVPDTGWPPVVLAIPGDLAETLARLYREDGA